MEPVRLGVVGCGVIGPIHMSAAQASPLVDIVAVADIREDALRQAAERFSVPATYPTALEMFDDPNVEAVLLALPARDRTEMALQAFARGKHVLTEKPVAMNADEVRQMIAAKGDLVAGCCSSRYRFLPSSQATTDFLATGALGAIRVVRCRAVAAAGPKPEAMPPTWRLCKSLNAGGILTNWGCYDMDYLLGIMGWSLRPQLVLAQTWPIPAPLAPRIPPESDAETHFTALVLCEGGTAFTFDRGEYMQAAPDGQWQIIGEKGSLTLMMGTAADKKIVHQFATDEGIQSQVVWEGEEEGGVCHSGPVTDFAGAIREGRPTKTSLEQALIVQEITDAIYASAERGEAVAL